MSRRFLAVTHLTLPMGLAAGPGATHLMLQPGSEIDVADAAAALHARFLNLRVKAGDLRELAADAAPNPDAPPAKVITPATGADVAITTGAPLTKQEG